jgi:hypothetical protein
MYADRDQVAALVGVSPESGSATLTPGDADLLIGLADAEIDAICARAGVSISGTTPAAVVLASVLLSAARWEDRIYTGQDPNRSGRSLAWRREALGALADNPPGELGGILGAWLDSQGSATGVRWQTELSETTGTAAGQPWFER